jgi:hypothetical protein
LMNSARNVSLQLKLHSFSIKPLTIEYLIFRYTYLMDHHRLHPSN